MTYFYQTYVGQPIQKENEEEDLKLWESLIKKSNWRIVKLPNGYYQSEYSWGGKWIDVTRRSTIDACEKAIDMSIEYYKKRLEPEKKPLVVKTFK